MKMEELQYLAFNGTSLERLAFIVEEISKTDEDFRNEVEEIINISKELEASKNGSTLDKMIAVHLGNTMEQKLNEKRKIVAVNIHSFLNLEKSKELANNQGLYSSKIKQIFPKLEEVKAICLQIEAETKISSDVVISFIEKLKHDYRHLLK